MLLEPWVKRLFQGHPQSPALASRASARAGSSSAWDTSLSVWLTSSVTRAS